MSFGMTNAHVEQHMRDVRCQVARCRGRSEPGDRRRAGGAGRGSRLRGRVGFALIGAGLRLLAADQAARPHPSRDTA